MLLRRPWAYPNQVPESLTILFISLSNIHTQVVKNPVRTLRFSRRLLRNSAHFLFLFMYIQGDAENWQVCLMCWYLKSHRENCQIRIYTQSSLNLYRYGVITISISETVCFVGRLWKFVSVLLSIIRIYLQGEYWSKRLRGS